MTKQVKATFDELKWAIHKATIRVEKVKPAYDQAVSALVYLVEEVQSMYPNEWACRLKAEEANMAKIEADRVKWEQEQRDKEAKRNERDNTSGAV